MALRNLSRVSGLIRTFTHIAIMVASVLRSGRCADAADLTTMPAACLPRPGRRSIPTQGAELMDPASISALTFDVFGTVVDWRSSITREGQAFGRAKNLQVDWVAFADAWRGLYQPSMDKVRSGSIGWTKLDDLHRMALDQLLVDFKITGLS